MKIYKLILTVCICVLSFNNSKAQTKAKPAATKQTIKPVAKKPAKPLNVYVCTSPKDKFFHKYSSCKNLNKCSADIKNIKSASELKKYKRKSCLHCFNL